MDELLARAEEAALSVDGVAGLAGKRMTMSKEKDQRLVLDVFLNVRYGCKIPEMAWNIQETVKKSLEAFTETEIAKINIHVQGVSFDEQQ
jgi:uncharacterized alkaline shock family protein YloU